MTITLNLAPDVETYLQERAARGGQEAEVVAQALLMEAMARDTSGGQSIRLVDYGISPAQAAELRASFTTFAGEWERPEMDLYDDYDAAKARLETSQTETSQTETSQTETSQTETSQTEAKS